MGGRRLRGMIVVACLVASLPGCAPPQSAASRCTAALGPPMLIFDLFFGRAIPARGDLTEAEWQDFLNRVITPNLPNGYTVLDAKGAWMNPITHRTIEEATKVLLVALPEVPESLAAVNRIRTAYQLQFQQQLVGMAVQPGCGSF
jgi:Protein of unknown function (DUF3574)